MRKSIALLFCLGLITLFNQSFSQVNEQNELDIAKKALRNELKSIKSNKAKTVQPAEATRRKKKKKFDVNEKVNGKYLLIDAIETKNELQVAELIQKGANVAIQDDLGNTPLLLAIVNKLPEETLELLITTETINRTNQIGETPLAVALLQERQSTVDFLIQKGANKGDLFLDKIWLAIEQNDMDLFQDIVRKKGNLSIVKDNETPLTYSIKNNKTDLRDLLLQGGANPMVENTKGETPYMLVLSRNDIPLFRKMLNSASNINTENSKGETVLDFAFRSTNSSVVKELLKKGAKFGSSLQQQNTTPLMLAIEYNKPEFYTEFIGDGNINQMNNYGKSAMILAIEKGDVNLVNELISYGASVHQQNYLGNTPLGYAVANNQLLILTKLIEMGADINQPNNYGSTPLMEAAFYNYPDMVRVLVQHGANKIYRDNYGMTAREIAEHFNNNEVLSYFY